MRATADNTKIEEPQYSYPMHERAEAGPTGGWVAPPPAYQPPAPPERTGVYESRIKVVPTFHSYRNYRIFKYIGSSIILSIAVFVFSLVLSGGRITFYVCPATFGLMTIWHITVLYLLKKESHHLEVETRHLGDVYTSPGSNVAGVVVNHPDYAPTATTSFAKSSVTTKIWTILSAWILALAWWACVALIAWAIAASYMATSDVGREREYFWTRSAWIKYGIEGILTFIEASTVTLIAYLCTQERSASKRSYY
ncbi:hypothetical protein NMY22_g14202 [Coprinellus aureogranulatus]|nr:hypothetical protein NMY22_g14202 [Coprinellus aureogranulatus]